VKLALNQTSEQWVPAFAGMTAGEVEDQEVAGLVRRHFNADGSFPAHILNAG
jgi:Golgi nucleoside diphosphatase